MQTDNNSSNNRNEHEHGEDEAFEVRLTHKGKHHTVTLTTVTTASHLLLLTREAFHLNEDASMKLLCKGKVIVNTATASSSRIAPVFPAQPKGKKIMIIMVMVTDAGTIQQIRSKRSDPLIRSFDNELKKHAPSNHTWGPIGHQHKSYKFVKIKECQTQSFGHTQGSTPHSFAALRFLEQIACDPGMRSIMVERELVVNTLGEMDPIDDRIMQKMQSETDGSCLLGYNTNHGLRIDVKLRTDDLEGFRPYEEVMRTVIHELSHNWVGDHNVLFWSNYAQMRVEYLWVHAKLWKEGYLAKGRTTVDVAGLGMELAEVLKNSTSSSRSSNSSSISRSALSSILKGIQDAVVKDLAREVAQHGIPVQAIVPAIQDRCRELLVLESELEAKKTATGKGTFAGHTLGGNASADTNTNINISDGSLAVATSTKPKSARDLALEAAERRRNRKDHE